MDNKNCNNVKMKILMKLCVLLRL